MLVGKQPGVMRGCCSLLVSELFSQIGLPVHFAQDCAALPGELDLFSASGRLSGLEAGEPRRQPRGSSWRVLGQSHLDENRSARAWGGPGSGVGRLFRQRKRGQSRPWGAQVLLVAEGGGSGSALPGSCAFYAPGVRSLRSPAVGAGGTGSTGQTRPPSLPFPSITWL